MDYFIYISDQKVDMLANQIPTKRLRRLARQFEFSVKLPWVPFNATYKPGDPIPSDVHRINRVRLIEKALDPDQVGGITVARPWIKSSLRMTWGFIDGGKKAVWFFGKASDTNVLMGGSAKHLLGGSNVKQQPHHAYSLLPVLSEALMERAEQASENVGENHGSYDDVISAVRLLINTSTGPRERLDFLARRLLTTQDNDEKLIVATPLYVMSNPI